MAVSFAKLLHDSIQSKSIKCNFQGIVLGDSWISPIDAVASWPDYLDAFVSFPSVVFCILVFVLIWQ